MKKNKKKMLLLFVSLLCLFIGGSFAYWMMVSTQTDFNIASSECFKVILTNEGDSINLQKTYPVTDDEGLKENGYSFTIKNTCTTYAAYQVNLEDILDADITKRLDNAYIKVSLNGSTPRLLSNYNKVSPTITGADTSFKLTSGSLAPNGEAGDSVDYNLKLWMDYDTPALEETMSASFKSKISVIASYIEGDKLTNDITITYNTKATDYTKDGETIDINAISTNYNLIEYSTDNMTYTSIDTPSKNVIITKTYTEDKDETIYFRDEMGNLKSESVVLSKLDKTGPVITVSASSDWNTSNTVDITLEDNKSGLSGYALTETDKEPTNWTSVTGKTATITKDVTSNKTYYVYAKDALGNISHKEVVVSHVDTTAPTIVSLTEQSEYGATSTITAVAKDTESGIIGYAFTESSSEPTSWTSVDNVISESTYTYKATKNGTIYFWVKDGAGHIVNKTITVSKVDATAPTVTLSLSDETTWTKTKTLTMNFSDNDSGLAGYAVTTTETTPTTWKSISGTSISKIQTINTNGTYYVWVKDKAGLVSHVSKTISYIDTTAPTASMTLTKTSDSITVDASASSDNESGIAKYEYSIDGSTYYSSTSSTYTFTGLSGGTYTVYLKITDKAENIGNIDTQIVITVPLTTTITQLAKTDTTNLAADDYGNTRYIGANPNNYVSFDGDIWRIIGVMKDIDDGIGNKEDRVKIIRASSIGSYSWDKSDLSINKGNGVNEWSQADLMKLLNDGYDGLEIGGSLYWNNQSGRCYFDIAVTSKVCDFTNTGIKAKLKSLIGDAVWNTGSNDGETYTIKNILVTKLYEFERGSNNGKICIGGQYCNDTIARTNTWSGKIGLMYPSDYGYATSGGSTTDRATCLNTYLFNWNSSGVSDCKNNDWLYDDSVEWTISPYASFSRSNLSLPYASYLFITGYNKGAVSYTSAVSAVNIRPVTYLLPSVVVQSGNGSSNNPFILG